MIPGLLRVPRRLPWRVRRLPRAVPLFAGLVYAASILLSLFKPNLLCGPDPWELTNALLWPANLALAAILLRGSPAERRVPALFGGLLSIGAVAVLSFVHFLGPTLHLAAAYRGCGCFGPVELPYGVHVALLGAMAGCLLATFLHEETRLAEGPPPAA